MAHVFDLHHWSATCIYSSISFELWKCSFTAAFPFLLSNLVVANHPRAIRPSWSPLCRAEKRRFEAARARLAPILPTTHFVLVAGFTTHRYTTPLAPLAATTADTKTITNRFARAMGRGQREVGRWRRGRRGKEGGITYLFLSFDSPFVPLQLSFSLVSPRPSFWILYRERYAKVCMHEDRSNGQESREFVLWQHVSGRISLYPVLREGESVCTLLAYRWYCITSGQLTQTYKDQLCASCYHNKNWGEA